MRQKSIATGWDYEESTSGGYANFESDGRYDEAGGAVGDLLGEVDKKQVIEQKLVHRAYLTIEGKNTDSLGDQLADFAKKFEGYLSDRNSFNVSLRIPKDKFEMAMNDLDESFDVISKRISVNDVTYNYSDLQVRLENTEQARLKYLALLEKAQNVQEALLVEKELERLNMQFDQLKGQIQGLDGQITYATIQVSLKEKVKLGVLGAVGKGIWVGVRWLFVRN